MARLALEADGFVVVGTATDGESAVAEVLRLRPDIVLLDVGLPDMTGFEVAARLREAASPAAIVLASSREQSDFGSLVADSGARGLIEKSLLSGEAVRALVTVSQAPRYSRTTLIDLVVATPVFLDLTFVGLESLPGLGEERFAAELLRTPGGGAITAVGATRLGLSAAVAAPLGEDVAGDLVRGALADEGVSWIGTRPAPRTPTTVVMPFGGDRAMVTVDPGARALGRGRARPLPTSSCSEPRSAVHRPGGLARLRDLRRRRRTGVRRATACRARTGSRSLRQPARGAPADGRVDDGRRRQEARPARRHGDRDARKRGSRRVQPRRRWTHSRASPWPIPSTRPARATSSPPPTSGPTCAAPSRPTGSVGRCCTQPSPSARRPGIGGAVSEAELMRAGNALDLVPPPLAGTYARLRQRLERPQPRRRS